MNWLLENGAFFCDDPSGDFVPFLAFLDPAESSFVGDRNPWMVYGFLLSIENNWISQKVDSLYILLRNKTSK